MDQSRFLSAWAVFIGLHITTPFMSMLLDHSVTPRELLTILPNLYLDLKVYPESLCQTLKCGIPSMQPYFLNPHVKETSPYGSNVCKALSNFLTSIDKNIIDLYLKKLCSIIGDALKRQCGDCMSFEKTQAVNSLSQES